MNDHEKAVVMAYTGVVMLTGDKLGIFHKYIEDICGRPIWTHELAIPKVWEEIKEKSMNDFIELCDNEDSSYNNGYRDGRLDACRAHTDEMQRLKAENIRLTKELETAYETIVVIRGANSEAETRNANQAAKTAEKVANNE